VVLEEAKQMDLIKHKEAYLETLLLLRANSWILR